MKRSIRMRLLLRCTVFLALVFVVAWVGANTPALAPERVPPFERLFVDAKESSVAIATDIQVSVDVPLDALCPDVVATAKSLGWENDDLDELDYVAWRESRCLPHVHFDGDPHGGSYGIMQINGYWCEPSKWHPNGYLQHVGVLSSCDDLYNPIVNLVAAQEIFLYSSIRNGNGWKPWSMDEDFCGRPPRSELCPLSWGGKGGG